MHHRLLLSPLEYEKYVHQWGVIRLSCRSSANRFFISIASLIALSLPGAAVKAASAEDLNRDAAQAVVTLYKSSPVAEIIGQKATAILVFPRITKAGLMFGGSYGEGVLLRAGKPMAYYNAISGSWGLQAGAESYGYIVFLMNEKAISYLNATKGWELGIDPSVVVVNEGVARNLSTTTLRENAYAFIFDQQGLMGSLSIQGTKISKIDR